MSCNGCRVLRKGCNENCILRESLQGIESSQAQSNATVFVAKFFGRAGLMSFLSGVRHPQRPALFQSLLFEACGRTVNPVSGAVGLLWTGNWHVCQSAVETVLRGGIPGGAGNNDTTHQNIDLFRSSSSSAQDLDFTRGTISNGQDLLGQPAADLNLRLQMRTGGGGRVVKRRAETPPPSEESDTTTLESRSAASFVNFNNSITYHGGEEDPRLLRLFF